MDQALKFIIEATFKGAGFKDASTEFGALKSQAVAATGGLGAFKLQASLAAGGAALLKSGFSGASDVARGFGLDLSALSNPMALVGSLTRESIDKFVQWGGTIDELSRITGQGAEETSKLAIVMGDIGVSTDTLKVASKALKDQGLVPTLDTIKQLAKDYQAIEDPVERNKWGAKTLGKAYFDLSEALSRTPEELDALADAAERSGKVMTEEGVRTAELFEQRLKMLGDRADGVKVQVGNFLVEGLLRAGDAFDQLTKIDALNTVENLKNAGSITEQQAQLRRLAILAGDVGAAYEMQTEKLDGNTDAHERAAATTQTLTQEEILLNAQVAALNTAWQNYGPTVSDAVMANDALRASLEPVIGVASDLKFGMGELTTATLYNAAAAGLSDEAAYQLAVKMGLIDDAAAAAKSQLDILREQFAKTDDLDAYTRDVGLLDAAVRSLPAGQTITIEIFEQYRQQYLDEFNAENSGQGGTESGQAGGAQGDGYASGVQGMVVPPGYPHDSFPMRVQSGEVVDVWQSPSERAAAMGGGTTIINNIYDHRAMAMVLEQQRRADIARAESLMG